MGWWLVFAFGGLGAVARVAVAGFFPVRALPWGTLLVNVVGCVLIGVAFQVFEERAAHLATPWRRALVGGFLGGFTTFSAFGLELFTLLEEGRRLAALLYAGGSLTLGLLGVVAGVVTTRSLL